MENSNIYKGKVHELNATLLLMNHGFECFRPIVDLSGSDLLVFKNNKYFRIQIKGCNTEHKTYRAAFSFSKNELKKGFDFSLCLYKENFWFLPRKIINSKIVYCNTTPKNVQVNKYAKYQNTFILL